MHALTTLFTFALACLYVALYHNISCIMQVYCIVYYAYNIVHVAFPLVTCYLLISFGASICTLQ